MPIIIILLCLAVTFIIWLDSKELYRIIYSLGGLILLTFAFDSIVIHSSFFEESPWYLSGRTQDLVILYMGIWCFVIGIIFWLIRNKINLTKKSFCLAFLTIVTLAANYFSNNNQNLILHGYAMIFSITFFVIMLYLFMSSYQEVKHKK